MRRLSSRPSKAVPIAAVPLLAELTGPLETCVPLTNMVAKAPFQETATSLSRPGASKPLAVTRLLSSAPIWNDKSAPLTTTHQGGVRSADDVLRNRQLSCGEVDRALKRMANGLSVFSAL